MAFSPVLGWYTGCSIECQQIQRQTTNGMVSEWVCVGCGKKRGKIEGVRRGHDCPAAGTQAAPGRCAVLAGWSTVQPGQTILPITAALVERGKALDARTQGHDTVGLGVGEDPPAAAGPSNPSPLRQAPLYDSGTAVQTARYEPVGAIELSQEATYGMQGSLLDAEGESVRYGHGEPAVDRGHLSEGASATETAEQQERQHFRVNDEPVPSPDQALPDDEPVRYGPGSPSVQNNQLVVATLGAAKRVDVKLPAVMPLFRDPALSAARTPADLASIGFTLLLCHGGLLLCEQCHEIIDPGLAQTHYSVIHPDVDSASRGTKVLAGHIVAEYTSRYKSCACNPVSNADNEASDQSLVLTFSSLRTCRAYPIEKMGARWRSRLLVQG